MSDAIKTWPQDPDEKLDYMVKWKKWLGSDTIAASTWIVEDGLDVASPSPTFTDTEAVIWLSGGRAGRRYVVTNRITTAGGRVREVSFRLEIRNSEDRVVDVC